MMETEVVASGLGDFEALIHAHRRELAIYAAWHLPDGDRVDEVIQRTFIRAYEQRDNFRPGADPAPWLKSICRFMILAELKEWKRSKQNKEKYHQQLGQILAEEALNKEPAPEGHPLQDSLAACRESLPDDSKRLVQEKYELNMSVKAIASEWQREVSWVTTRLSRIRAVLRVCVENKMKEAAV